MARETARPDGGNPTPAARARARFRKPTTVKAPLSARAEAQREEGRDVDYSALIEQAMDDFPKIRARLAE
ncbi:hypothetical protein [Salinarimonas sp.]|uniref:hypothetical protein n=1 Tax=Salinarimonas sp. TaxID=2766526 RepID=UPI0032D962DE